MKRLMKNLLDVFLVVAATAISCTSGNGSDDWRIRHAAQLVADTNNPVGLIAEQSGFSSRSHFNSLFREKYKMTPSEYRKVAKEAVCGKS